MIESRCGILCNGCEYQEKVGCKGCVHIDKPFWSDSCAVKSCCEGKGLEHCGQCAEFPCDLANAFAYDEKEGDGGKRLTQCREWCKGYSVKENGPIYFTQDMDETAKWFEEVLGWYSEIDERNEEGKGCYGCVCRLAAELEVNHLVPFTGIHMFYGKPRQEVICFMKVQGIEKMRNYILSKGWDKVTEVEMQPWGGKTCSITTIDGSIINVFE